MNDDVFDGHVLAEKLFKLNSSQQSIESLSRLCISHRKKAKQIVETWDKSFKSAQREQRVSFLYLANDILQNSRRKGNEFVNEFWKVLPAALKHVYEKTDEQGKKAASRLVDIWDERRVFGSRGQNLKDEMLGKNSLSQVSNVSNGKSSNPIKIVKRDAHSLRIKLAVGGMPEKILTAFQLVHDEHVNEETALNNCEGAVHRIGDMERDVESNINQGNLEGSAVLDEIQEQENVLQQCVSQLECAKATRTSLVSQLKEALHDQELKLELIQSQLQVARRQVEQAASIRQKLASPSLTGHATPLNQPMEVMRVADRSQVQQTSLPPPAQTLMSFVTTKATDEENKKAAAAAVVAKLAASTSSAQMLTSVLSSLVAEEAASISGGFKSAGFSTGLSVFSPEKRQKLEKPMSVSDASNSEAGNSAAYFASLQQQSVTNVPLAPPTSMQPISQSNQTPFTPPPPPPPPPGIPGNAPTNQFVQSSGLMMGVMPYVFGGSSLPPPPPLPSHISIGGLARPAPQPPQQPQSQQPQQQQQPQHQQQQQQPQQTMNGGYYRPPGIGFYGQTHHPAPPPVPRQ